jgi:hypothetical protein
MPHRDVINARRPLTDMFWETPRGGRDGARSPQSDRARFDSVSSLGLGESVVNWILDCSLVMPWGKGYRG